MLINLRNALMTGRRMPTAKDYVQNGLVAMWDGIENAGFGTHDPNATTWKDLIGGASTSLHSSMSFGDDYLQTDVYGINLQPAYGPISNAVANPAQGYTEEICVTDIVLENTTARQNLSGGIRSDFWMGFYGYSGYFRQAYNGRAGSTGFTSTDTSAVVAERVRTYSRVLILPTTFGCFFNGVGASGSAQGTVTSDVLNRPYYFNCEYSSNNGVAAKYRNVRWYSRALTADEIARNYAIDKARFGLP